MTRQSTATPAHDAPASAEPAAKPRILIVDDEPSMRDMLRIVLRRDGYDVTVAANGTEAIDILEARARSICCSRTSGCPTSAASRCCAPPRKLNRDIVAFMMTAFASTDTPSKPCGSAPWTTSPSRSTWTNCG